MSEGSRGGESKERLKLRIVAVKGVELRLRSRECADADISDYLQGSVERAREELERGIEWATKEVFWVKRRRGDRDEKE